MSRLSNRLLRARDLVINKGSGEVIPADFADRLREPSDAEEAILADLAKSGATDEDLDAAAGALRLLDSVGLDVDGVVKESKPKPGTPLDERGPIPPWFVVEIENERRKNPQLQNVDDDTIMRRLLQEHPEWAGDDAPSARDAWDDYGAAMSVKKERPRTPEERERVAKEAREFNEGVQRKMRKAEAERVEKERRKSETMEEKMSRFDQTMKSIEILQDKGALDRIDEAAARLRKADPKLTKSQAVVKACEDDPDLYASYQRHQFRQMGAIDDSPERIKKAADAEAILAEAARPFLQADPSLSHSQAVQKALESDPSLYTRTTT